MPGMIDQALASYAHKDFHLRMKARFFFIICIALVVPMEGDDPSPSLVLRHTPGTDWITQRGMLQAALDIERNVGNYYDLEGDDE